MQHMVIYRSSEGKPSYHQSDELDGAVKFVERLRNDEQISDARIFQMDEVAIAIKTYYRVELAEPGNTEPATDEPAGGTTGEMTGPTPVDAGSGGRFGLFSRT